MSESRRKKAILAAMVGNALEYYEVTLYGFFAVFLSPLFFPLEDPKNSLMVSFVALAAGLFMRPLGALLFGHFGDKIGRKKVLLLTILLVTIPTTVMGLLPTYETIGIAAPILIVICRLTQGFCTSAEYGGAVTLISESSPKTSMGFSCSWLPCSSMMGATLGTMMGALCMIDGMPGWAWRIPFLLGGCFGIIGYFLRNNLQESPAFKKISQEHKTLKIPILDILKYKKRSFLCTLGMAAAMAAPFYISSTYILSIMVSPNVGLSSLQAMLCNVATMLFLACLLPITGYFSDKIGIRKSMILAALFGMTCALPIFYLISGSPNIFNLLLAQVLISLCAASLVGPSGAYLTSLFPARERYSGVSVGSSMGEAIFGGTSPLIAAALVTWTGSDISPAFYLIFCCMIGLLAVLFGKEKDSNKRWTAEDLLKQVRTIST